MLKRERAQLLLRDVMNGAIGTAFVTFTGACAHTSDASYAPASAPQQPTGASYSYEAPAPAPAPAAPAPEAPASPSAASYSDNDPAALQDFHPALDAHGTWVDDPTYGTVWTPSVAETGPGFVPYVSGGHWVYGDDYTWASDYSWGWAPFHYGRWVDVGARGWCWIPGREYAPAWVEWRTGDAYVGWSPAPPAFIWRGGVAVTLGFAPPAPPFVYSRHADLFAPQPGRVVIMGPRAVAIGRQTRFYGGPDRHGHFHAGPPLASLHVAPERVVRATGHERGLARAQAFSRPSSASRPSQLRAHPPVEARSRVGQRPNGMRTESPQPKLAHAAGPQPKLAHAAGPQPKLAHAASPRPKVTPTERQRPEGRTERQPVESRQPQRQEAPRREPARTEATHQEPARAEATHQEPARTESPRPVRSGPEHNAAPQATPKPASHTEERRK